MKKIQFTTFKEVRSQLKEWEGVSGIYMITFPQSIHIMGEIRSQHYIGQSTNLRKRVREHLGAMNPENKGSDAESEIILRKYFGLLKDFEITLFTAPEYNLNFYENLLVSKFGSISVSRFSMPSRSVIPNKLCEDFAWITEEEFANFKMNMPVLPSRVAKSVGREPIMPKPRPKVEEDYGF